MTAQIEVDEDLMNQIMQDTGTASASEAVDAAFRFYKRIHAQRQLLDLQGTIEFWPDYDYKAMRQDTHLDEWHKP